MSTSPVPRLRLEKMSSVGQLVRRSKVQESKANDSDEENYEENYNRRNSNSSHLSYDDYDYDRRDYYGRHRNRMSQVDKIEIIRKAFRHLCRDPTVKMRTLQDIRLQFGTPNADGTMRVSSEVFRKSIPKLMSIVQVDDMTSLNQSDIDYLIEEIDLNHDHSITYSEFINFIAFPQSKLRKIARAIQQKLSNAAKSDADVRQLQTKLMKLH